jgi:hypothetical protein
MPNQYYLTGNANPDPRHELIYLTISVGQGRRIESIADMQLDVVPRIPTTAHLRKGKKKLQIKNKINTIYESFALARGSGFGK